MLKIAGQEHGNGELIKPQHLGSAPVLQFNNGKATMNGLNLNRKCTLPPDANHRQFRYRLPDGSFKKMDKRIRNSEELKQQLNKYNPLDVYVSVSSWLNPELVGAKRLQKAGWKHLRLCLLKSDYFMDFDAKSYTPQLYAQGLTPGVGIEGAYRTMIAAWEIFKQNYSEFTFARTHNGFHFGVEGWYDSLPKKIERVQDRIEYVWQMKKRQTTTLRNQGLVFDYLQSINVFQIMRVWESVHRQGTMIEYTKNPFTKALLYPRKVIV